MRLRKGKKEGGEKEGGKKDGWREGRRMRERGLGSISLQ